MIGSKAPLCPFGEAVKQYFFLVDRQFSSPGIQAKVNAEINKIPVHVEKGDLSVDPATDEVFFIRKPPDDGFRRSFHLNSDTLEVGVNFDDALRGIDAHKTNYLIAS